MSMRDDLRPTSAHSHLENHAARRGPGRSEDARAADTARACEALGIPATLPPPQPPSALDREAADGLLRDVEEYLREVFGKRTGQAPAVQLRPSAGRAATSFRDAA